MGGIAAGVSQTCIGYPFDVIKFRLQNRIKAFPMPLYNYYRGCFYPLLGGIAYNGITFYYLQVIARKNAEYCLYPVLLWVTVITPLVFIQDVGKIKKNLG